MGFIHLFQWPCSIAVDLPGRQGMTGSAFWDPTSASQELLRPLKPIPWDPWAPGCKDLPNSRHPPQDLNKKKNKRKLPSSAPAPRQLCPALPASRGSCSRPRCGWNGKRDRFRWWLRTWSNQKRRLLLASWVGLQAKSRVLTKLSHSLTEMIFGGYPHDFGNLQISNFWLAACKVPPKRISLAMAMGMEDPPVVSK